MTSYALSAAFDRDFDATVVEMIDLAMMTDLTGSPAVGELADEVKTSLTAALASIAA